MTRYLDDPDGIDVELDALRTSFSSARAVLDNLSAIQEQFRQLAQKDIEIQQRLVDARRLVASLDAQLIRLEERYTDVESTALRRIDAFEQTNQQRWTAYEGRANEARTALSNEVQHLALRIEDAQATAHERFDAMVHSNEQAWTTYETRFNAVQAKVEEAQAAVIQLFASLEESNTQRWSEFRNDLLTAQNDLYTAQRNLRSELGSQINGLKGEAETRFADIRIVIASLEVSAAQRLDDALHQLDKHTAALELRIADVQSGVNERLASIVSATDTHFTAVETRITTNESAVQTLSRHHRTQRIWSIVLTCLIVAALIVAVSGLWF